MWKKNNILQFYGLCLGNKWLNDQIRNTVCILTPKINIKRNLVFYAAGVKKKFKQSGSVLCQN